MCVLIKSWHHAKSLSEKQWLHLHIGFVRRNGENLQDLEESFKKGIVAKDEEEAWMGCMTCDQYFHIKCLLGEVTEEKVDEVSKDMEKQANKHLKKTPIDDQGKRDITGQELIELPLYLCKKWYVSNPNLSINKKHFKSINILYF